MYLNGTGNDNRVPARETVVAKSSKLPNDLDAEDDGAGDEDFEFVESSQSNKKGKVVKHVSTVKSRKFEIQFFEILANSKSISDTTYSENRTNL